jgi:hypothetical protein
MVEYFKLRNCKSHRSLFEALGIELKGTGLDSYESVFQERERELGSLSG